MFKRFERNQVYRPERDLIATGAELGRSCEDVYFPSTGGLELNGWFYPAAPGVRHARQVFLICHGNAGNISYRLELCAALLSTGPNVFVFDYRGYGRSPGEPDEEGTAQDALAACRWLEKKGFAGRDILVYGESLGGAVGAELASRETVGGLVLQSTFTSVPDIGTELFPWLPVRWLGRIRYDTRRKLSSLRLPVLVMHSREDRLVGFHHAERNFAAANEPKLFWELHGGHNEALDDRRHFVAGIEKFLSLVGNPRPEPA